MTETSETSRYLRPGRYVDSDHPEIVDFARSVVAGARSDRERAARLFTAVRDRVRYDPYRISSDPDDYRASAILGTEASWCVPKAVLLAAVARAVGIPARLGFADVRNHLSSPKLRATMGTDLFIYHGYAELFIDGAGHKATPAFNKELCERFGVRPLEFDGSTDALLHEFDGQGRRHMEYVHDRGTYEDLPFEEIIAALRQTYGDMVPPPDGDAAFAPSGRT